jgi:hypothetical protein
MAELLKQLDPVLFWDAKKDTLNEDTHADYIIRRVCELGDIYEIIMTHAYYGTERCRLALLSANYLRESAIVQGMAFLEISNREMFKCFVNKQYHPL